MKMDLLNEIINSMKTIGGNVKLEDLYKDLILKNIHLNYIDIESFEGSVRARLQINSVKSPKFNGNEIFENVGKGVWKLKNIKEDIIREANPEKIIMFIDSKDDEMFAISKTKVFFRSTDQSIYPGINIGDINSLRLEIDFEGWMKVFFVDQKNREWNLGFTLRKDYLIEILKLVKN
jgi:hypothetical protein